jgi:acetyl esterase
MSGCGSYRVIMPLHPFVKAMLENGRTQNRPAVSDGSPQDARDMVARTVELVGRGPDVGDVCALEIPSRVGSVGARLIRSQRPEQGLIVYLHGGGWVCGNLDYADIVARNLVRYSECAALVVDYRLAPEYPFPAGLEDCEDAIIWAYREMPALLGSRLALVVAGDSAGGNLCAVATASLRGQIDCALQVLFYPITDSDATRPSYRHYAEGLPLTRKDMQWFFGLYAPEGLWTDPRIAPLRQPDLAGCPPTWIVTAEYDVLRDEGEAYAQRLSEAGVPVEIRRAEALAHGFVTLPNLVEPVASLLEDAGRSIASHCAGYRAKAT